MSKYILLFAMVLLYASMTAAAANTTTYPNTNQEVRIGNLPPVPAGITPPKLVRYVHPIYTDEARRRGVEGVVTLEAEFDIDGNFKVLRMVKSLGYSLDESALAAVQKWRFTPAYRAGQRVSVVTQVDVSFSLFDDPQWLRELNRRAELEKRGYRIETIRSAVERWENQ